MIEKIKSLAKSKNYNDHLIAIELIKKLPKEKIMEIFTNRDIDGWLSIEGHYPSLSVPGDLDGIYYPLNGGYIAYNGLIWFVKDKKEFTELGYKLGK